MKGRKYRCPAPLASSVRAAVATEFLQGIQAGLEPVHFLLQWLPETPPCFHANFPVVIINWVHYLGPPGPFSFPDSRDLLEVLGGLSWQRERDPREDPLGSGRIP